MSLQVEIVDGELRVGMTFGKLHHVAAGGALRCPECGERIQGSLELVPAVALASGAEREVQPGEAARMTYDGTTEMDWDGQTTAYVEIDGTRFVVLTCRRGCVFTHEDIPQIQ